MARSERRTGRVTSLVGLAALSVLILFVGTFSAVLLGWSPFTTTTVDRSAPVVLQELQDIARYKAATGQFSELVDVEKDVKWVPDFVAGQRTVMVAVGSVDAEVDFSQLSGEQVVVSPDGKRVEIHLPPAELAEANLDMEQSHVASRNRGIANRLDEAFTANARDDGGLYQKAEEQITAAAQGTELRSRAEDNTRAMLTGLLQGLGYDEVVVTFDAPVA